jgi:hypothetical protein
MTYLLIDTKNLFFRIRHGVRGETEEKIALALHMLISSIHRTWRSQGGDHIVFAFDGISWRKDIYPPYKKNREVLRAQRTVAEREEDEEFQTKFDAFTDFISTKTNCTILSHPRLEADDLIAGFIQNHPNDNHVIVSSDGDFVQLLAPNVKQFNAMSNELVTLNGVFNEEGKVATERKTGLPKAAPDPEWSLFSKAVRGCTTDNVFSAYPKVREKSSKNKVGLREAFDDRNKKGFAYTNLMLSRWTDHNGAEHRVLDDYHRNVTLVDLTAQPAEIRAMINDTIEANCKPKNVKMVGINFMRFCGLFQLERLSNDAQSISKLFSMPYPEAEHAKEAR